MKSEELRQYEEEFRAMREMFGTYYLELGRPAAEAGTTDGKAEGEAPPPEPVASSWDGHAPTVPEPSKTGS